MFEGEILPGDSFDLFFFSGGSGMSPGGDLPASVRQWN